MKEINVKIGDRIEYRGSGIRSETGKSLSVGDIGRVIEIHSARAGVGWIEVDGEDFEDRDRDGYACVDWPTWGRRLIRVENEGKTWRRA